MRKGTKRTNPGRTFPSSTSMFVRPVLASAVLLAWSATAAAAAESSQQEASASVAMYEDAGGLVIETPGKNAAVFVDGTSMSDIFRAVRSMNGTLVMHAKSVKALQQVMYESRTSVACF